MLTLILKYLICIIEISKVIWMFKIWTKPHNNLYRETTEMTRCTNSKNVLLSCIINYEGCFVIPLTLISQQPYFFIIYDLPEANGSIMEGNNLCILYLDSYEIPNNERIEHNLYDNHISLYNS